MYCSQCGTQVPDDSVFCHECGRLLTGPAAGQQRATGNFAVQQIGAETERRERPLGITLVCIYSAISAVLTMLVGFFMVLVGELVTWMIPIGMAVFLVGVLELAAVYGLWTYLRWGHSLAVVLYAIAIPLGLVVMLVDTSPGNVILQVVGIALAALIIWYLIKPDIKRLYGKA